MYERVSHRVWAPLKYPVRQLVHTVGLEHEMQLEEGQIANNKKKSSDSSIIYQLIDWTNE